MKILSVTAALAITTEAASVYPSGMDATGAFRVRVIANLTPGQSLQASSDLRNWTTVKENVPIGADVTVTDPLASGNLRRFYRLSGPVVVTPQLSDLAVLRDQVFPAGEGFNSVQYAPSGALGFIAWRNQELIYRERNAAGAWSEHVVTRSGRLFDDGHREEYRFQPQAALLFDSASRPQVVRMAGGSSIVRHTRESDGRWSEQQINAGQAGSGYVFFAAALGAGDKLHLALVHEGGSPSITHGSDRNGGWQWNHVARINGNPRGFFGQSYAPRYFGMAVDSNNRAHIVYTPETMMGSHNGYVKPYSELGYASDASGQWRTEIVMRPPDSSGDAGTGASIAIAPGNVPVIASWFVNRADTGSSQESYLYFHTRGNGSWSKTQVTRTPSGYAGGDGNKGSGFSPYVRFDAQGRPHIVFMDHAAGHFSNSGQNEYAGNLRLASWNGSEWKFRTIAGQSDPMRQQFVYPAFAVNGNELAYTVLDRSTQWGPDQWPRSVSADYSFRFGTMNLQ